ncbi:MAG: hypothetical protein IPM71_08060 [Bacteroidota bacterium]|nr:MAG: hypothetical protein IPM71_08060 [Bacteroidota bacterium]
MKQIIKIAINLILVLLIISCDEYSPAELVTSIDFKETYKNEVLNLPNGSYSPDNPYFEINKPETWTGNMAKYVNHNYLYSVSYSISNLGDHIAYDTEIDLFYTYDNGENTLETLYIGDIQPNESINYSTGVGCTNKQLVECSCVVYWYE